MRVSWCKRFRNPWNPPQATPLPKENRVAALENLNLCLGDIKNWNLSNMLKWNRSKTEIIHFSSHFSPAESIVSINLKSVIVTLSLLVLSETSGSRLIDTSPMSTTFVALVRARFILLAESESILRKRILSALQ